MIVKSQLVEAQVENLAADPSAAKKGRIYHNTVDGLTKVDDGTNIRTIVTTDNTQTLTNKKLSDSTTSIVDDGDNTKQLKFQCSGITTGTTRTVTVPDADLTMVGTATTQALTNKEFSDSTLHQEISTPSTPAPTKWRLYFKDTGLHQLDDAGTETKLQAGNNLSYTSKTHADTGYSITGSNDVILWTLTDGNNDTATLPAAASNNGKVLRIKLAAATASFNTLTVSRAGSDTITLADGTTGATSIVLQTSGQEYELVSDGSSVWQTLNHRNTTAWTSYTPTWASLGTVSGNYGFYRRVGDSLEAMVEVTAGTASGGQISVSLPSGLSMDTAKMPSVTTIVVGIGGRATASGTGTLLPVAVPGTSTTTILFAVDNVTTSNQISATTDNSQFDNSKRINCRFTVPISGWKA